MVGHFILCRIFHEKSSSFGFMKPRETAPNATWHLLMANGSSRGCGAGLLLLHTANANQTWITGWETHSTGCDKLYYYHGTTSYLYCPKTLVLATVNLEILLGTTHTRVADTTPRMDELVLRPFRFSLFPLYRCFSPCDPAYWHRNNGEWILYCDSCIIINTTSSTRAHGVLMDEHCTIALTLNLYHGNLTCYYKEQMNLPRILRLEEPIYLPVVLIVR
jgi:hypothetical protein